MIQLLWKTVRQYLLKLYPSHSIPRYVYTQKEITTYVYYTYKNIWAILFVIVKTRKTFCISHQLLQSKSTQKLAADNTTIYISLIL